MRATIVHNHPIHYKHLLFPELRRQGLDLDVIFLGRNSSIRHESIELSGELYRAHVAWPGSYESAPTGRKISFTYRKLSQLSPDVVIISGYHASECWAAWLWAMLAGKPIVMWYESNEFDYPRHWFKELPKRLFCSRVCRAHVYGTSNKEYLVKLGIPSGVIDLKRAVVNVKHFAASDKRAARDLGTPTRFLYVGRLAPEKNVETLLLAFARSLHSGYRSATLTIAGTGPDEQALKRKAVELGVADKVGFLGYTTQNDLPSLYQACDVFVLPSVREPWGLVALEAMLGRLPVILSNRCGCTRDLVSRETGWEFCPNRPDELAARMTEISKLSYEQLLQMGNAAFELAKQYSASNCAEVIIRSLERLYPPPNVREATVA